MDLGPAAEGRSDAKHPRNQVPTGMSYLSFYNTMPFSCGRTGAARSAVEGRAVCCKGELYDRSFLDPAPVTTAIRLARVSVARQRPSRKEMRYPLQPLLPR